MHLKEAASSPLFTPSFAQNLYAGLEEPSCTALLALYRFRIAGGALERKQLKEKRVHNKHGTRSSPLFCFFCFLVERHPTLARSSCLHATPAPGSKRLTTETGSRLDLDLDLDLAIVGAAGNLLSPVVFAGGVSIVPFVIGGGVVVVVVVVL